MDATIAGVNPDDRRAFHIARYRFAADRVAGMIVADVACGTGYGSHVMVNDGALIVVGVDIDTAAIAYASGHHKVQGVSFRHASACNTGMPSESFDAVVSFETLEHVPDDAAVIAEFARILRPGGLLICSVPNKWGLSKYHVRSYDRESFDAALSPAFVVDGMWNQNSGDMARELNHGQPAGIVETTDANYDLAECLIAVGVKR